MLEDKGARRFLIFSVLICLIVYAYSWGLYLFLDYSNIPKLYHDLLLSELSKVVTIFLGSTLCLILLIYIYLKKIEVNRYIVHGLALTLPFVLLITSALCTDMIKDLRDKPHSINGYIINKDKSTSSKGSPTYYFIKLSSYDENFEVIGDIYRSGYFTYQVKDYVRIWYFKNYDAAFYIEKLKR